MQILPSTPPEGKFGRCAVITYAHKLQFAWSSGETAQGRQVGLAFGHVLYPTDTTVFPEHATVATRLQGRIHLVA